MSVKSKKTKLGNYVCKIGKYDVRQLITSPRKQKNYQGQVTIIPGSIEGRVCSGKNIVVGKLKSCQEAIKEAYALVCKEGTQSTVSKKLITKHNLTCE